MRSVLPAIRLWPLRGVGDINREVGNAKPGVGAANDQVGNVMHGIVRGIRGIDDDLRQVRGAIE